MFFFFDADNPNFSFTAFEAYVFYVLRDYLLSQGKSINQLADSGSFDAFLPNGIDEISEPTYLEIKSHYSSESGYFHSIQHFTESIREDINGVLFLVLGDEFSQNSKDSMRKMIEARIKGKALIWDINDFNAKTAEFQKKYEDFPERPTRALIDGAINNPTSSEEKENKKLLLISELKKKYRNEEMVLFLGAGVSNDAGIPLWKELVNQLLAKMITQRIEEKSNPLFSRQLDELLSLAAGNQEDSSIAQMRYIRGAFNGDEYYEILHDVLYSQNPQIRTELLDALAQICIPRRNHTGVQGVVTYNFDDLFERRLQAEKVPTNTIFDDSGITDPAKLSVFHVHGFLPQKKDETAKSPELVFSEEDYHRIYRDVYCWSNIVQLNFFRENTCLFVGCSLSDPNLRRLLDVAARSNEKPRHFAFLRKNSVQKEGIDSETIEAYKNLDITLREKYYAAMGLRIIWIDSFEEIPKILRELL